MSKHCCKCNAEYGTSTAGCLNPDCSDYYLKIKEVEMNPNCPFCRKEMKYNSITESYECPDFNCEVYASKKQPFLPKFNINEKCEICGQEKIPQFLIGEIEPVYVCTNINCDKEVVKIDGYESLRNTLVKASEHASKTKGVERHASGEPFEQQKICQGGRKFGVGAPLYQTWKKIEEAHRMATSDKFENGKERAIQELYGAINYTAAAIIILNEQIKRG